MLKTSRYTVFLVLLLLLLGLMAPVLADTADDEQRLRDIQQQMQTEQNRRSEAQQQVNSLSEQLRIIQNDMDDALVGYKEIQTKRTAAEEQIRVNSEVLAQTEKDLSNRRQIFGKRMRDVYENGQISYLDVLFGATDFRDFATRVDILRRVFDQDIAMIGRIKAEQELIVQKRQQLESDRAALVELEQQAAAKKAVIENRKREREAVLGMAVYERDAAERAYQELQETSRDIEEMLRGHSSDPQATGASGVMMWPVRGPITSPFGWRTHPIFGTQIFHSGLDIGTDYGDPVRAADSGVVIDAGWMGGYGKAIIIDHGGGISTLYGHNSELLVSAGQRVSKGQVIAHSGATGYATGPHVHFEVRVNGKPANPYNYLP